MALYVSKAWHISGALIPSHLIGCSGYEQQSFVLLPLTLRRSSLVIKGMIPYRLDALHSLEWFDASKNQLIGA